jgi:hypothetical protein
MKDKCPNCGGEWIEVEIEIHPVDVTSSNSSVKVPLPTTQRRRCEICRSVQMRSQNHNFQSSPWEWEKRYSLPETRDKCRCCDGLFIEGKPTVVSWDDNGRQWAKWINIQHRRCNKCQLVDRREQLRPDWGWSDWKLYESPPHVTEMFEAMKKQFHENREKYRVKSFETLCKQLSHIPMFRE